MSNSFYYEDGKGNIADEQGNEAMDYGEELDPFNNTSLLRASRYRLHRDRLPLKLQRSLILPWKKFRGS